MLQLLYGVCVNTNNEPIKTEEEIRRQKKLELMNVVTELSGEINRLDDMLEKLKSIVYNL
jgi:hypothetical protein